MIRTLALILLATPAAAQLAMPYPAVETLSVEEPFARHVIATGPMAGTLPTTAAEGRLVRRVWKLEAGEATTLQILAPLRAALEDDGWTVVFDCAVEACGGFGFRFAIDVAPAPDMFVNLADYHYLSARKDGAWTTLVVSRSGEAGYVQVTTLSPGGGAAPAAGAAPPAGGEPGLAPAPAGSDTELARALRAAGHAVLSDLDFATGSAELSGEDYASLAALAAFLEASPSVTIALVGHTDAEGSAEGNMAVSRRRAESARALLTGRYGIAPARVEARGVGYYAPVGPNDTAAGREANRRVEAVITSTE